MQALRNSLATSLFLAGIGFAQAQTTDSAAGSIPPRQVERVSAYSERESPYRKAIRAHYADEIGFGAGLTYGGNLIRW